VINIPYPDIVEPKGDMMAVMEKIHGYIHGKKTPSKRRGKE